MSTATALREAATGTKRQLTLYDHINDPKFGRAIAAVAGKIMTPDRMLRLCINAVKKTPDLMKCDPQTVLGAMMASAALGLEPNTVQQQAFLIPYKRNQRRGDEWVQVYDCQFQVGARGFITLAYRSPAIKFISAGAIHQGDKWEQEEGSQAFLRYAKTLGDRGPLIGSFSYVRFTNGDEGACVLPLDEILKIRSRSETFRALTRAVENAKNETERRRVQEKFDDQPWVMWEDDMASKSATKKHAKLLPLTAAESFAVAADLDDRGEAGVLDLAALTDPDVVRSVVADESAPPAIAHSDPETLDFGEAHGATARQRETVAATQEQQPTAASNAKAKPEAKGTPAAKKAAAEKAAEPAAPTYAQLANAIAKAKDRDAALLELDLARHLPQDQYDDLVKVLDKHHGSPEQ